MIILRVRKVLDIMPSKNVVVVHMFDFVILKSGIRMTFCNICSYV